MEQGKEKMLSQVFKSSMCCMVNQGGPGWMGGHWVVSVVSEAVNGKKGGQTGRSDCGETGRLDSTNGLKPQWTTTKEKHKDLLDTNNG